MHIIIKISNVMATRIPKLKLSFHLKAKTMHYHYKEQLFNNITSTTYSYAKLSLNVINLNEN